jgi:outer membrane biosynthesis protein TonB
VGYLTVQEKRASPVQASRLITVGKKGTPTEVKPEVRPETKPEVKPEAKPEPPAASANTPLLIPAQPAPPQVVVPVISPAPPPEKPMEPAKIVLSAPEDGARIRRTIVVKGSADPDSKVAVTITYSNGLQGLLKLAGNVASQVIAVGNNGEFRLGPIPLEGPLATKGLRFTIKAHYPDRADHGTAVVTVIGDRD